MRVWPLLLLLGFVETGVAATPPGRDYARHEGYLDTTMGERENVVKDVVMVPPPEPHGPTLRDRLFTSNLTKEFQARYEAQFGRTDEQRVYQSRGTYMYFDDDDGFGPHSASPPEEAKEERRFAEYMMRRLTEYHVERYAKSDPKVRPAWELSQRISNVKVQVTRDFRMTGKYSISSNTFELGVLNPYANARASFQMNPSEFGPSVLEETTISLDRDVSSTTKVEGHYEIVDGIFSLIGRRAISPALSTSLTGSTYFRPEGTSKRETLVLAGVTYRY